MKILVSNDDGIDSRGIYELAEGLKEVGEVTVVAPLTEQSAVGHSITMKDPLRVIDYYKNDKFFGYAVDGTPADCVKMAVRNIMDAPPDIIVSGINHGSNTATNVIYSGTVSAAREAAIMDYPAIAISMTSREVKNIKVAANVAKKFTKLLYDKGINKGTLLNINVPDLPEEEIKGVTLTKQGFSKWDDVYEKRQDPYGRDYYWLTGSLLSLDNEPDRDEAAIRNNYISVSPIQFDLTDYKTFDVMKDWDIKNLY